MPTFSLIVPIYGVEEYLPKCIESVLTQTCRDFELLLIDDASPDRCGEIIDDYAARYPDLVFAIHQENGGSGAARNHGIRLARGEYLLFIDGDDYVDPTLLADVKAEIDRTNADLVLFGAHVERNGKKNGELHDTIPCGEICSVETHRELFFGISAPWSRAYRKTLFEGIEFASKVWYQDIRVVKKINTIAKTVVRLGKPYYHYIQRDGSALNNKNAKRNIEIIWAFDDILSWFRNEGLFEKYRQELMYLTIEHVFVTASVRVALIDRKHPLIAQFREYLEKEFPDFRECKYLPQLGRNRLLVYRLLLKKRYRTVRAMFRLKKFIEK